MAYAYLPKGKKTYKIKWYDSVLGTHKQESAKTTVESVAIKKAKKKTAELELGLASSQLVKPEANKLKLTQAFEEFLAAKNFSAAYVRAHRRAFKNITEVCGDKYCRAFSQKDFDELMRSLRSVRKVPITTHVVKAEIRYREIFLSENTIANYTRHLSVFFEWLLKRKYITESFIIKAKENIEDPEPIPAEDQKRIFDFLFKWNKKTFDLFKLMYLGAYRASELCSVNSMDFEYENQIMRVKNFKGKRVDRIPLLSDTREHLQQMEFSGELTGLQYNGLKSLWARAIEAANKHYKLTGGNKMKYHLHQIRKSRGTDLANIGCDLLWLHKFMRHTSLEVTRKYYIKVDIDKAREALNGKLRDSLGVNNQDAVIIEPGVLELFKEAFGEKVSITRIVNQVMEKYLQKKLEGGTQRGTQKLINGSLLEQPRKKLRLVK